MSLASHHSDFDRRIGAPLRRLGRTLKRRVLVEGACGLAAMALTVVVVHAGADRLLDLGVGPRVALLAIVVGVLVNELRTRMLRPMRVRIGPEDIAAVLERKNPGLRDTLISAVAFAAEKEVNPQRNSPAMVAALMEKATQTFGDVRVDDALRHDRHRKFLAVGGAALVAAAMAVWWAPDTAAAYVARDWMLRDVPWPSRYSITLEDFRDGTRRHPLGDELTLVATAAGGAGEVPAGLTAEFETPDGETYERPMDRRGVNQFVLDAGPLASTLRVRLLIERFGVDERTGWYRIEAVERPGVREARVRITPPAYAAQEPFTLPAGQMSADVLRGSRVRIEAALRGPVKAATLSATGLKVADAELIASDQVAAEFTPTRSGAYGFDLTDAGGLTDTHPMTFSLRLVNDTPPKVRLALRGCGELVVPGAILNLAVEGEDNLGLASMELRYQSRSGGGTDATTQPANDGSEATPGFEARQTRYGRTFEWPLTPLNLTPGSILSIQVRGKDFQPPVEIAVGGDGAAAQDRPAPDADQASGDSATGGPTTSSPAASRLIETNVGESSAYTLRVVTREELLADLGRREQEWRREFEQVIKSQEQLNTRVMDARDQAAKGGGAEVLARFGQESRTQRQQIGRMKTVRGQFEQILAELDTNQLVTPQVRRRLEDGVVVPLGRLITTDVVEAADTADRLRTRFDAAIADDLERRQTRIVQAMYAILANMLKWEGYNEAIALLQDIVKLQDDLNKQTQGRMEQEIERLFGETPSSQPASQPEDRP